MTWREDARPIIAAVIARVGKSDLPALRRALREAFPWGERKYHPYRMWLDEINVQLGTKRPPRAKWDRRRKKSRRSDEKQPELF